MGWGEPHEPTGVRVFRGHDGAEVRVNRGRYDTRDPLRIAMVCEDCGGLILIEQWAHDAHERFHDRLDLLDARARGAADDTDALACGPMIGVHSRNTFPPPPPPVLIGPTFDDYEGAPV